jgi:hypothetical protein
MVHHYMAIMIDHIHMFARSSPQVYDITVVIAVKVISHFLGGLQHVCAWYQSYPRFM